MKITFLGTGTSTGVPMIGCRCEVCRSTDPHDRRLRSSVLIEDGDVRLLIDAGPDFRAQALGLDLNRLDAVLLTHEHYDHVGGIDDLRPLGNVEIYGEQRVLDAVVRCVPYAFGPNPYPGAPRLSLHAVSPLQPISVGHLEVLPLRLMHGELPILGFRIGSFAYLTDVKTIPEETYAHLQDLDLLVLTALRQEPHPSHICLQEALDEVRRIAPKRALFTHFSHDIGLHRVASATLSERAALAYDGLQIEL